MALCVLGAAEVARGLDLRRPAGAPRAARRRSGAASAPAARWCCWRRSLLAALALVGLRGPRRAAACFTAVPEGRFLRITHDDYVHVTYRVAELRQDPPPGSDRVPLRRVGGDGVLRRARRRSAQRREPRGRRRGRRRESRGARPELRPDARHRRQPAPRATAPDRRRPRADAVHGGAGDGRGPARGAHHAAARARVSRRSMAREGYEDRRYVGVLPGVLRLHLRLRARRGAAAGPLWLERSTTSRTTTDAGPVHARSRRRRRRRTGIAEAKLLYAEYGAYNLRMLEEVTALARERGFAVACFEQPLNLTATLPCGDPTWAGVLPAAGGADALAAELRRAVPRAAAARPARDADFGDIYHLVRKRTAQVAAGDGGGLGSSREASAREPAIGRHAGAERRCGRTRGDARRRVTARRQADEVGSDRSGRAGRSHAAAVPDRRRRRRWARSPSAASSPSARCRCAATTTA